MDTVNSLKILNTLNLAVNDAVNSKHSEHSEFGTWWCFERTL